MQKQRIREHVGLTLCLVFGRYFANFGVFLNDFVISNVRNPEVSSLAPPALSRYFSLLQGDARKKNAFVSTCVRNYAGLFWRCSSNAKNRKFSSLAPSALSRTVTGDAR